MLLNLKSSASRVDPLVLELELDERLPVHVTAPCLMNCKCSVQSVDNYFLIMLDVDSTFCMTCQRCLNDYHFHYSNQTILAACHSDEEAEKLMKHYECVVYEDYQVDLKELLTDDLHLYVPESHLDTQDCCY